MKNITLKKAAPILSQPQFTEASSAAEEPTHNYFIARDATNLRSQTTLNEHRNLRAPNSESDESRLFNIFPKPHYIETCNDLDVTHKPTTQKHEKRVSFADTHGHVLDHIKYTDEFTTKQQYNLKTNYGCRAYPIGPTCKNVPANKIKKSANMNPPLAPRRDGRGHREAAAISYKQVNSFSERGPMKVSQQLREVRTTIPAQQTEYLRTGSIESNLGYGHSDSVDQQSNNEPKGFWGKIIRR